ncbi:MAG: hypothetical protein IPL61_28480 [Myxococcales bacterium]|nr:hypothetical protein [Myxococcales bacterium]
MRSRARHRGARGRARRARRDRQRGLASGYGREVYWALRAAEATRAAAPAARAAIRADSDFPAAPIWARLAARATPSAP